ncbi:MAG: hypothetical protein R3B70_23845 [Polyangiaceae bacterium]
MNTRRCAGRARAIRRCGSLSRRARASSSGRAAAGRATPGSAARAAPRAGRRRRHRRSSRRGAGAGAGSGTGGSAGGTGGSAGGTGGSAGGTGGSAGGTGGSAGGTGGGGGAGTGGSGGASTGGSGGASTGAGGASTGGAGGASTGGAGGAPGELLECKLVVGADGIERACRAVGAYPELSPCNSAADCGAGLGCVLAADQGTGVCREYCCGDVELCGPKTFCAPRPMAEANGVSIPVCVDADDCTLLEDGQCADGLVCTVVRADGTTACVPPGTGKQGEPCPCAPGFACTKLLNECRKICHTKPQGSAEECEPGYGCQGNSSLPEGFGLCIATSP